MLCCPDAISRKAHVLAASLVDSTTIKNRPAWVSRQRIGDDGHDNDPNTALLHFLYWSLRGAEMLVKDRIAAPNNDVKSERFLPDRALWRCHIFCSLVSSCITLLLSFSKGNTCKGPLAWC